jgi:enoyl-CoA hydratase
MSATRSERRGRVGLIHLNQPEKRNALTQELIRGLVESLVEFDEDSAIGCIVVAGNDRVFAAGADLRLLAESKPTDIYFGERAQIWRQIRSLRKPTIAAVSGHCLGGGFELALSLDAIVASETARFGLPETALGLVPGAGGIQMLVRAIGRSKAFDVVLGGRTLTCEEAERCGIVCRSTAADSWLEEAVALADAVAEKPLDAQLLAKEAIGRAFDVPLEAGIEAERRAFAITLASNDAREGIAAFLEKRPPRWRHEDGNDGG